MLARRYRPAPLTAEPPWLNLLPSAHGAVNAVNEGAQTLLAQPLAEPVNFPFYFLFVSWLIASGLWVMLYDWGLSPGIPWT